MLAGDVAQLLYKIHLQGAADAAVLQGYKAFFLLSYHTTFLNEVGIDVHFANIIHDDGELYTFSVIQYSIKECCLSAAQITREQQNGYFFHFHC